MSIVIDSCTISSSASNRKQKTYINNWLNRVEWNGWAVLGSLGGERIAKLETNNVLSNASNASQCIYLSGLSGGRRDVDSNNAIIFDNPISLTVIFFPRFPYNQKSRDPIARYRQRAHFGVRSASEGRGPQSFEYRVAADFKFESDSIKI